MAFLVNETKPSTVDRRMDERSREITVLPAPVAPSVGRFEITGVEKKPAPELPAKGIKIVPYTPIRRRPLGITDADWWRESAWFGRPRWQWGVAGGFGCLLLVGLLS